MSELCPLCNRELGEINIDRHHLIPKSKKGKIQEKIHRICHRKIHATFSEKELEKKYHTWEELKQHQTIKDFIIWIQKKDPGWYNGTANVKKR